MNSKDKNTIYRDKVYEEDKSLSNQHFNNFSNNMTGSYNSFFNKKKLINSDSYYLNTYTDKSKNYLTDKIYENYVISDSFQTERNFFNIGQSNNNEFSNEYIQNTTNINFFNKSNYTHQISNINNISNHIITTADEIPKEERNKALKANLSYKLNDISDYENSKNFFNNENLNPNYNVNVIVKDKQNEYQKQEDINIPETMSNANNNTIHTIPKKIMQISHVNNINLLNTKKESPILNSQYQKEVLYFKTSKNESNFNQDELVNSSRFKTSKSSAFSKAKTDKDKERDFFKFDNSYTKDKKMLQGCNNFNKNSSPVPAKFINKNELNLSPFEKNNNAQKLYQYSNNKKFVDNNKPLHKENLNNFTKEILQISKNSSENSYYQHSKNLFLDFEKNRNEPNKIIENNKNLKDNKNKNTSKNNSNNQLLNVNYIGNTSHKNESRITKLEPIKIERNQIYSTNELNQINNFMGIPSSKNKIEIGCQRVDFFFFYKLTAPMTNIEYDDFQKYKFIHTLNINPHERCVNISYEVLYNIKIIYLIKLFLILGSNK